MHSLVRLTSEKKGTLSGEVWLGIEIVQADFKI